MKAIGWLTWIPWFLGFILVANFYLLPGNASSPRATDVVSLMLWAWLFWRLMNRGIRALPLVTLMVLNLIPLLWGVYAYMQGLRPTLYMSLRWLLALPWGCLILLIVENRQGRTRLIWGLWWGLVLNTGILIVQYLGWEAWTMKLGLAARDSDVVSIERWLMRNPGMHGHANASAAVASLIVPVGLYLYFRVGAKVWVPLASLLLVLAAGHITSSRSPLLISGLAFVVIVLTSQRFVRSVILLLALGLLVWPLWMHFGPPGGKIRWADTVHMAANTNERLASNVMAVRIAVDHPFGLGIKASQAAMQEELSNPATHNAFLQVGIVYGPLQAGLLFILLASMALQSYKGIRRPWGIEALMALQVCGLFFFEEHMNNPTFILLTTWLAAASIARFQGAPVVQLPPANGAEVRTARRK